VATSQQSACHVTPQDLAAIAKIESDFGGNPAMRVPHTGGIVGYGQFDPATWRAYGNGGDIYSPADGLAAIDRVLCARGYADNRTRALNSFGGCTTPTCLGETDYATQITALGQGFRADWGVVAIARSWLTKPPIPYVFGGSTRAGVDCSGLTVAVYGAVGVHLNRTALAQYQQKGVVTLLGQEQAQPGDLLFFSNTYMPGVSHVGIYTGDGMMVNAVNEQVGVALVPAFTGYWGSKFTAVGRVTPP